MVEISAAKFKLDHVIKISRVEMYKPIQVAEVLRRAISDPTVDLANKDSYRVQSRAWRDEVTQLLFGKRSTSSARYQDDLWNESAVPPDAMAALGRANQDSHAVESYIYRKVLAKSAGLENTRTNLENIESVADVSTLLDQFDGDGMSSSADRMFEILATSVFQTELGLIKWLLRVTGPPESVTPTASWSFLREMVSQDFQLQVGRLGRTNAADVGLDIWTNFGVVINVKRRELTIPLLAQVLEDTPVGRLHIVCRSAKRQTMVEVERMTRAGRGISVTTESELLSSLAGLLSVEETRESFKSQFLKYFDHEFPIAQTLTNFLGSREYLSGDLPDPWRVDSIP